MLVLQNPKNTKDAGRTPNFVINNYFNDAFFLKGLGNVYRCVFVM
jgi:integrin alpha FG-GAP repeat containing protein 1